MKIYGEVFYRELREYQTADWHWWDWSRGDKFCQRSWHFEVRILSARRFRRLTLRSATGFSQRENRYQL